VPGEPYARAGSPGGGPVAALPHHAPRHALVYR